MERMTEEKSLKQCPFCGSSEENGQVKVEAIDHGEGQWAITVVCSNCGASAPLDTWNLRYEH
jgi:hypothetical protein